jgi:hypothetical protein
MSIPVAKKEKIFSSNFFITINTQKTCESLNDPLLKRFKSCVGRIKRHTELFLRVRDGSQVIEDGDLDDEKLLSLKFKSGIEIGSEQHRLHTHMLVAIQHKYNDVKINIPKLTQYVQTYCKIEENIMINVIPVKSSDYVKRYLKKQDL